MSSKCWICGHEYVTDYCTKCGPPEPWGPTPEEMLDVLKKFAEENEEEEAYQRWLADNG